ncbi:MAG: DNA polymerase [Candidatus Paceibacterota bacterium]
MSTPKHKTKKTLVLLDVHAILHRAYHALPDFSSPSGEPTGALYGLVAMLLKIGKELDPDYMIACFDLPGPTYRHTAFKQYKAGRIKSDDELVAQIIRTRDIFSAFNIPMYECVGFEADDILGTIVEQTKDDPDLSVIIASGDMDTLQLVEKKQVQVYTLRKGIKDTVLYDEKAVKDRFGFGPLLMPDYKGLRGDPSDNIPGIAGIGEKTATTLITQFGSLESMYKKLKVSDAPFIKKGITPRIINLLKENEEEAEFSKMLGTIRRDAPITFTLPTVYWKSAADVDVLFSLFSELGFRALAAQVKTLFELNDTVSVDQAGSGVSGDVVKQAAVMLWLIESERTNPTYEDIIDYGRSYFETTDFKLIVEKLKEELERQDLTSVYTEIELPLMEVIEYMNSIGVLLDTKYLKKLSKNFHAELTKIEQKIYAAAGSTFNLNSPKQLGIVLYDTLGLKPKNQKKTATGQRSTRESELEKMKDENPIIADILRYRELQKLLSTYIDNMPAMVGEDGRLRTTFLQTGTTTGRMASKDPNLQNIPIRSEEGRAMRKAFVASPGFKIVSIDYAQIDLRIAAILSGDEKLIEIFKRGEDVHSGVAARVFSLDPADVTSEMRRRAKVINFGILYGMGVNALRSNLGEGTSREEAQEFLNAYFNTFTRLAEYLEEVKAEARTHGFTTTLFGRRRYFPGITSSAPFIRAQAERMAINAPVQGTAADVMRIAMNKVYQYIATNDLKDDVRMLLQVHDEIVFEIRTKSLERIIPELIPLMEEIVPKEQSRGVATAVAVETGDNWTELEKWSK